MLKFVHLPTLTRFMAVYKKLSITEKSKGSEELEKDRKVLQLREKEKEPVSIICSN